VPNGAALTVLILGANTGEKDHLSRMTDSYNL
jgi:hypothetical protein